MARSRKIISLALALVMAFGVFAINTFATAPAATFTLAVDSANPYAINDTITLTITASASEDFYVGPFSIPVEYDSAKVTFVSATVPNLYGAGVTDYAVNSTTAGKVVVSGWNTHNGTPVAPNLNGTSTVIATLTFTATANGSAVFAIDDADIKDASNPSGKFFMGSFDGSNPKTATLTEVGQTLTVAGDVTAQIGSAAPNTLEIKASAPQTPIIDTTNVDAGYDGTIYGIDTLDQNDNMAPEASIEDCLTTTLGDAYLVIEDVNGYQTTGTEIKVLDADGVTVLETYVFVYFGDVDADGYVGGSDGFIAEYYEAFYEGIDNLAQYMAADLDADGMVGGSDGFIAAYYEAFYEGITCQADIAALAQYNTYDLI